MTRSPAGFATGAGELVLKNLKVATYSNVLSLGNINNILRNVRYA